MSRKVERNEDFENNALVWRYLTAFITAFCDFVSSTMDVYEAISTHIDGGWGQDDVTPQGVVGNQVQSDSIFLNTMPNNLHYCKVVQNPG